MSDTSSNVVHTLLYEINIHSYGESMFFFFFVFSFHFLCSLTWPPCLTENHHLFIFMVREDPSSSHHHLYVNLMSHMVLQVWSSKKENDGSIFGKGQTK